jgi:hypothetical protein
MTRNDLEIDLASTADPAPKNEIMRAVGNAVRGNRAEIADWFARARERIKERARAGLGRALPPPNGKAPIAGAPLQDPTPYPTIPPKPSRPDLVGVQRTAAANERRAFAAIQQNSRAIDRLATCQRELGRTLAEMQAKGDLALLEGICDGLSRLERRVQALETAMARGGNGGASKALQETRALRSELKTQLRAARIDKLNDVVASMQSSAFGAKGSVFATNNVLLALNQLLWGFGGDALRRLGVLGEGQSTAAAWLSPLGSLAVSQVALGSRQHERFISGVETDFDDVSGGNTGVIPGGPPTVLTTVSLEDRIGSSAWNEFRKRTDVPVVVTVLGSSQSPVLASGVVSNGVLTISLVGTTKASAPRVAWLVDTEESSG